MHRLSRGLVLWHKQNNDQNTPVLYFQGKFTVLFFFEDQAKALALMEYFAICIKIQNCKLLGKKTLKYLVTIGTFIVCLCVITYSFLLYYIFFTII